MPIEDRQVRARRQADLVAGALQPYAAEQVVGRGRGDQRQDHGGEQEAQHEPLEGVGEGEVGDVLAELRVLHAERRAVAPEHPGLPARCRRQAGEQAEDTAAEQQDRREEGLQGDPVALEVLLLERHRPERRAHPVGHDHVGADEHRHQQPEDHEQQQLGAQHRGEDRGVVDRPEPQQVGVEGDAHTAQQQDRSDDRDGRGEQAGAGGQSRPRGADGHASHSHFRWGTSAGGCLIQLHHTAGGSSRCGRLRCDRVRLRARPAQPPVRRRRGRAPRRRGRVGPAARSCSPSSTPRSCSAPSRSSPARWASSPRAPAS